MSEGNRSPKLVDEEDGAMREIKSKTKDLCARLNHNKSSNNNKSNDKRDDLRDRGTRLRRERKKKRKIRRPRRQL